MTTTTLATAVYADQMESWPKAGRHILARFDDETIIVYQAYCASIGRFAVENGFFGGDFKFSRMSWLKPNFLWMMYRSQWGQGEGQEVVLAIRLKRRFFDSLLAQAVPSSFDAHIFGSRDEWAAAVARSEVRLQWDPDHLPTGEKCERKAIQLGLRGGALEIYGKRAMVQIIDMSAFVAEQRSNVGEWKNRKLITPTERVYVPADPHT
ncbi:MAG TPA: DUF4291 domain-containing protein [Gemmataceae bacterium]|nr:DUF4291 domain-containing protein [Gemmataceae bacterium]